MIYNDLHVYIYYTDNNGVSWNGTRKLNPCDDYEIGFTVLPASASPFGSQYIYVPCYTAKNDYHAIAITSDLGRTWKRVSTEENKIGLSLFSFSKDAMGNEIVSYGGLYTLGYMKASDTKITMLKKIPEKEIIGFGGSAKEKGTKFVFWYGNKAIYAIENDMKD